MSRKGTGGHQDAEDFLSEIELLRSQLTTASERERELSTRLQRQATEAAHAAIKQESADAHFPPSPASRGAASSPYKPGPGASLGLMVSMTLCGDHQHQLNEGRSGFAVRIADVAVHAHAQQSPPGALFPTCLGCVSDAGLFPWL